MNNETKDSQDLSKEEIMKLLKEKGFLDNAKENFLSLKQLMTCYRCAMMEIETKLNVLNEELSLRQDRTPISSIKSRIKSIPSIISKIERRGLTPSIEQIEKNVNDVAGIRVCCPFVEDVYMIADALLSQDDLTLVSKKDYIKNPKENGYRSLHLIISVPIYLVNEKKQVKVEVQMRTIAMDFWASIEHQLRYKKNNKFTQAMTEDLLNCAEISAELDNKMSSLRNLILSD